MLWLSVLNLVPKPCVYSLTFSSFPRLVPRQVSIMDRLEIYKFHVRGHDMEKNKEMIKFLE